MGIKTTTGGGDGLFFNINAKSGCFQTGSGANKTVYEAGTVEIDGIVKDFKIMENIYEGKMSEQVRLKVVDTDPTQPVQFITFGITGAGPDEKTAGDASGLGLKILGKLLAADLTQPIAIKPWFAEKGTKFGEKAAEKDVAGVKISQGGNSLVEDFGNGVKDLPEISQVMAGGRPVLSGGKPVYDKTSWNNLLDTSLDALKAKIEQAHGEKNSDGVDASEAAAAVDRAARQQA